MIWQEVHSRDDWEAMSLPASVPLQQCWPYGAVMAQRGAYPRRLVLMDGGRAMARVQLIERRFFGLATLITAFRGPIWVEAVDASFKIAALRVLAQVHSKWRGRFLMLMPEEGGSAHSVMRALSMRCVVSGYSTIWLDLSRPLKVLRADLDGKWRNALMKAEAQGFDVSIGGRKAHQYAWLLEHEEEQRGRVGYVGLPVGVVEEFQNSGGEVVTVTIMRGRDKLAAGLFLLHEGSATYFIGWNGDEGRKSGAHNLMMWQALEVLKKRGIKHVDLGGLATSPESAGLARFKLGMGAEPISLAGSYI